MSTKDGIVTIIKEWVSIEQEIKLLQKELVQRRARKKILTDSLVDTMKTNEIDCFDINNGKIVYTRNKVRSPMSKKHIIMCLTKHLTDSNQETVQELTNYIMESRQITVKDKIQYKGPR